jgi:hypothetical protein
MRHYFAVLDTAVLTALAITFAFAMLLHGCGGPTREAQLALTTTARALAVADREVAVRYETAATDARERSENWETYDAAMHDWNAVEVALRTAHSALYMTQAGLDAWREGAQGLWTAAVPCLVAAVDRLRLLLEGLGVYLGPITEAVALVGSYAGQCVVPEPEVP